MKKILFIVACLLFGSLVNGQNLVPNWSFENYNTCPNGENQISYCTYWSAFRNFGEYYNACCPINQNFSVPSNAAGYRYAATGNAYAGIEIDPPLQLNGYRDYIGCQLTTP